MGLQLKKYNILVVEDEYIPANYIKKILQQNGHNVIDIVGSKEEALKAIEDKKYPDIILMDIKIKGGTDGIELAEIFQEKSHVAILYISAYANNQFLERAKDTHPIGYLVKPIQPQSLISTIAIGMDNFMKDVLLDTISFSLSASFNPSEHTIINNKKSIFLSNYESLLLNLLIKYKNKFVSYSMLENFVWGEELVGNSVLRTTVWRLRKKLPEGVDINNLYSSGYMISF